MEVGALDWCGDGGGMLGGWGGGGTGLYGDRCTGQMGVKWQRYEHISV